jgi:hypothetical protein
MKSRKEYFILIGLAAVLVLYLVLHRTDRTVYELPEIPAVKKTELTRIEIRTPEETIELKKEDGKWRLDAQGYRAAENKVDPMLEALAGLELTAMVSESENYTRYQLADEQRITVRAWAGQELARSIAIGKKAPSHRHTFVKLPDDPKVYHARENFRSRFDQSLDTLRDKTVLSFAAGDIQSVEIHREGSEMKIARVQEKPEAAVSPSDAPSEGKPAEAEEKEPVWKDAEDKAVDSEEMEQLLGSLSSLKCQRYITGRSKSDFSDPIYKITLTGPQAHSLSVFEKESGEKASPYPAVSSGAEDPFMLSDHTAKDFMSAFEEE